VGASAPSTRLEVPECDACGELPVLDNAPTRRWYGAVRWKASADRCKHRTVMVEPINVVVRRATPDDVPFIQLMLYEAANRPGDTWPTFVESMNDPRNRRFWVDWPRKGDMGWIAESQASPIGAVWIRCFSGADLSLVDEPEVPVLAIGVVADHRGRGVGGLLMDALVQAAREDGIREIALTTGLFNEPALRLYRRCGFTETLRREDAVRMKATLA